MYFFFFFNDTATTEIYTLSLHDALPILQQKGVVIKAEPPAQPSLLGSLLLSLLPIALMIGIVVWLSRNAMNKQGRSEEHTSELQSRQYLVCRLLLEKKKKKQNKSIYIRY